MRLVIGLVSLAGLALVLAGRPGWNVIGWALTFYAGLAAGDLDAETLFERRS